MFMSDWSAHMAPQNATLNVSQWVGPCGKCCLVQTKAHSDVFEISSNLGISHSQIYLKGQ
jgi:hypothetical protein